MNIQLVPRVCSELIDQSLCAKAIEACGENTAPALCTAKLVGKAIANPEPMIVAKSLYGFGKDSYHNIMQGGHDYLHTFAHDLIQNVSGEPGKIGTVGNFLISVLGAQ